MLLVLELWIRVPHRPEARGVLSAEPRLLPEAFRSKACWCGQFPSAWHCVCALVGPVAVLLLAASLPTKARRPCRVPPCTKLAVFRSGVDSVLICLATVVDLRLSDAGATMVIGTHPHILQVRSAYTSRYIVASLSF